MTNKQPDQFQLAMWKLSYDDMKRDSRYMIDVLKTELGNGRSPSYFREQATDEHNRSGKALRLYEAASYIKAGMPLEDD